MDIYTFAAIILTALSIASIFAKIISACEEKKHIERERLMLARTSNAPYLDADDVWYPATERSSR